MQGKYFFIFIFLFLFLCSPVGAQQEKYYHLTGDKMAEYIQKKRGNTHVVYFYTSWCGPCQTMMPDIIEIEKSRKGSVTVISMDHDQESLIRYLNKHPDFPFHRIIVKYDRSVDLAQELQNIGILYRGSFPHVVFYNADGSVKEQGPFKAPAIREFFNMI